MTWSYVLRRVAQLVPALVMILIVTFGVIHLAPGDPAGAFAGEYATAETIDSLNEQFGLDQPVWKQFVTYIGNVAQGDLGQSFQYARPVTTVIGERLPATLLLAGTALVMSVTGGILMGVLASRRPSGVVDTGVSTGALLGYAVPGFIAAELAVLLFDLRLGWFDTVGMHDTRIDYQGLDRVLDVARHLILPACVLAASEVALVTRLTRTGLIQQMSEGYVRTARAKGVPKREVLGRHAFPNAALPVITVIGTRIGFLFSGAVIIENVFSWPGVGQLLVSAVDFGDRPMALGLVLLVAVSVLIANFVTDLVYAWVDPRIRYD